MPPKPQAVPKLYPESINALKRACLYSLPPNRLGYCGPGQSWQCLEEFLSKPSGQNALAAREKLMHFNALFPYLELIAKANGKNPFDAETIEAYWLGNSLLENVQAEEMRETILLFEKFGLPRAIAEKKAVYLPPGIVPHHSMHVLYVNFISRKVEPIVKNLSECLVQWAQVLEAREGTGKLRAKGIELFLESAELKLREREKSLQNPFNLPLSKGDLVAVHWGNAIEKISSKELKSLKGYTIKNLKSVNSPPV